MPRIHDVRCDAVIVEEAETLSGPILRIDPGDRNHALGRTAAGRDVGVVLARMMSAEIALCFAIAERQVALKNAALGLAKQGRARLER
ncbi:MAG: hypothetical protein P8182_11360 [Deltaproteobacteria bacterium]